VADEEGHAGVHGVDHEILGVRGGRGRSGKRAG
jgi:hypothetical protein